MASRRGSFLSLPRQLLLMAAVLGTVVLLGEGATARPLLGIAEPPASPGAAAAAPGPGVAAQAAEAGRRQGPRPLGGRRGSDPRRVRGGGGRCHRLLHPGHQGEQERQRQCGREARKLGRVLSSLALSSVGRCRCTSE
uniref:Uncharacterized protein n=1 Tax=Zea mays TaxID=4577 RepID=B6TTB5_MAIZE|nr:hypothetical protein [Zea mays]